MLLKHALFALLFTISTPVFAEAAQPKNICSAVATGEEDLAWGKNLNKFLRSNPRQSLGLVLQMLQKTKWGNVLGLVFYDNHVGNMNADFVHGIRTWTSTDLDDIGFGPVLAGLVKTMVLTKSATKEVGYKEMVEAFMDGLGGRGYSEPESVSEILDVSEQQYLEDMKEYVQDKSTGNKLKMREDYTEMTEKESQLVQAAVKSIPGLTFLDAKRMKKEQGGSAKAYRYRILAKVGSRKTILDFKENMDANLFLGVGSQDAFTHIQAVKNLLFGDGHMWVTQLTVGGKRRAFTLREKIEVDAPADQPPKDKDLENFRDVTLYNLNRQGLLALEAAKNPASPFYSPGVLDQYKAMQLAYRGDPDSFSDVLKSIAKAVLKRSDEILGNIPEPEDEE